MNSKPHVNLSYEDGDYYHEVFYSLKPNTGTKYNRTTYIGAPRAPFERQRIPTGTELDAKGKLSGKAKSRLKAAINWMIALADEKEFEHPTKIDFRTDSPRFLQPLMVKFKIAFATFTLPAAQMHSDDEILNLAFQPMINDLRKKYGRRIQTGEKTKIQLNYVWKAELQENGNIHFHLATDVFIPYDELQILWNEKLSKLGYIDAYRKKMMDFHKDGFTERIDLLNPRDDGRHNTKQVWTKEAQLEAWMKGTNTNWSNPPSTQIKSVQRIDDLAAYLCKYMVKDEGFTEAEEYEYEKLILTRRQLEENYILIPPDEYQFLELSYQEKVSLWLEEIKKRIAELETKIVTCKLWDCSQALEKLKLSIDVDAEQVGHEVIGILESDAYKEKKAFMDRKRAEELEKKGINPEDEKVFFTVIPFSVPQIKELGAKKIGSIYDDFIKLVKADFNEGTTRRLDEFKSRYENKKLKPVENIAPVVLKVQQKEKNIVPIAEQMNLFGDEIAA